MTIPEWFPVFTPDDILEPPSEEYEVGEVRSTIGWLKHLFLYSFCEDSPDCLQITDQDRKDYRMALDRLKKVCTMKKNEDIGEWEDKTSQKKQATALNKLRRSLGYTEIVEG